MIGKRMLSVQTRRLLLGAFLLYLFGLLGYLGPAHKHEPSSSGSQSHPECQLCQISAQPYAAPEPLVCPEAPAVPVRLVEAVWEPILAFRFQPFSSRAPPSA
jgi:hypothetical protein